MEEVLAEKKLNKPVVAISIGEVNGIGPELVIKSLERPDFANLFTPLVFCDTKVFNFLKTSIKSNLQFNTINNYNQIKHDRVNVFNINTNGLVVEPGSPSKESGKHALDSLREAAVSVEKGHAQLLVTAPLDKKNVENHQKDFKGHTGFLAEIWKSKALMFLVSEGIRVALLSDHVPISEVAGLVTKDEIVFKTKQLHKSLVEDFQKRKPKIAVLGLNPHAGDNSLLGKEEELIISPAINEMNKDGGILVFGPYPADSFFTAKNLSTFDAVLAMYHDQGLVGFKTIAFYDGVNYTAGLPFVRTSPDHGTAYDIAGKNIADPTSMSNAFFTALEVYNNRKEYEFLKSNSINKAKSK